MLKTRALEKFLDQANTSGVNGIMLFTREGLTVAKSGGKSINESVYAALMSNIWETFERQGVRDDLSEVVIRSETGTIAVVRVANMLLAIIADGTVAVGILKAKLLALVEHLKTPLSAML